MSQRTEFVSISERLFQIIRQGLFLFRTFGATANGISVTGDISFKSGTSIKFLSESRFFISGLWYMDTSIFGIGRELLLFRGWVCFAMSSFISSNLRYIRKVYFRRLYKASLSNKYIYTTMSVVLFCGSVVANLL